MPPSDADADADPDPDTLYLVWPERQRPPDVDVPDGYALRTYRDDDRDDLLALLRAHWRVDDQDFRDFVDHVLPNGLFLAVDRDAGELVGTASALHNPRGSDHHFPFGGELGYVYVDPAHRRQGLGRTLAAAAVRRLDDAGYTSIRVGTDQNPTAALRYLDMGFQPYADTDRHVGRWRDVFDTLGLPFDRDRLVRPD